VTGESPTEGFITAEVALGGFHFDALRRFDFRPDLFNGVLRVSGWHGYENIVESALHGEDTVCCTGYPSVSWLIS